MLRRGLDALYAVSTGLAALSLLAIFLVMMAQVLFRQIGMQVPAADDISAFLCVSTTFFALAQTFNRGELIRVGMVVEKLGPAARRVAEIVALLLAVAIIAYLTFWTAQDCWFSWEIGEVAQGTLAIPLWIPKLAMPVGAAFLLIAILDNLAQVLMGRKPSYVLAAEDRAARGDFSGEV